MEFRKNQNDIVIQLHNTKENRLVNAQTSFGKTVTFCFFAKEHLEMNPEEKLLVVVHRDELMQQTLDTFQKLDIFPQRIDGKTKRIDHSKRIFVGMVGTIEARFKKFPNYITGNFP